MNNFEQPTSDAAIDNVLFAVKSDNEDKGFYPNGFSKQTIILIYTVHLKKAKHCNIETKRRFSLDKLLIVAKRF
jgi:hypothetical protein